MKVFVDSDVIISSLISSSGASYFLLHTKNVELFISNASLRELQTVINTSFALPVILACPESVSVVDSGVLHADALSPQNDNCETRD